MSRTKLDIYEKGTHKLEGTVNRTIFNQRQFGNWGAGTVSINGTRYDVVGRDVTLPKSVISKLKSTGELKEYK